MLEFNPIGLHMTGPKMGSILPKTSYGVLHGSERVKAENQKQCFEYCTELIPSLGTHGERAGEK